MLVLTRRYKEHLVIDGPCEIEILKIERGRVKIGIHSPSTTHVWRGELINPATGKPYPLPPDVELKT